MIAEVANHWPYIAGSWAATAAVLGGYVTWVLRRGRSLSRQVPEGKRRWM